MKERPIIFTGPMVRAILDGRKTQTRRVIGKTIGTAECLPNFQTRILDGVLQGRCGHDIWGTIYHGSDHGGRKIVCPYGQPGDRLWVRETWCAPGAFAKYKTGHRFYRADGPDGKNPFGVPWRPSIHMPRWASRIDLELTGVRVERVQEITEGDARAEGAKPCFWYCPSADESTHRNLGALRSPPLEDSNYLNGFANLWHRINKKRGFGWEVNPWVWVLEFRRVKP